MVRSTLRCPLTDSCLLEKLVSQRYSDASLLQGSQPASGGVLDMAYGGNPFFSLDAVASPLGSFSTGVDHGDGWSTGHWKDNLALGLLDPTITSGELAQILALDIRALDVIGYDIPEPATATLTAMALLLCGLKITVVPGNLVANLRIGVFRKW